jgi:hypothetical protein
MADLWMLIANVGELLESMNMKNLPPYTLRMKMSEFIPPSILEEFLDPKNWNEKFTTTGLQMVYGTVPINRALVDEASLYVSPWYTSKEDNFLQNKRWALQILANDTYAGKENYHGKYMLISKQDYEFVWIIRTGHGHVYGNNGCRQDKSHHERDPRDF